MSTNAKMTDTAVYLIWAYQGVIMDDISLDEDTECIKIHLSVPSNSFLRDREGNVLASSNLIKKAIDTSDLLSMSMKFNQGVDVKFQADERNDDWTKTDASSALNEMMEKLFNGNPFQGVM